VSALVEAIALASEDCDENIKYTQNDEEDKANWESKLELLNNIEVSVESPAVKPRRRLRPPK